MVGGPCSTETHDGRSDEGQVQAASHPLCVVLYCWLCFSEMSAASLLYAVVVVGPMPPEVLNTRGVKDPCSISRMRSS